MSSASTSESLPSDISRGSELLIISWLTVSIALLLVSLRFFIRGVLRKNLGWDDHLILLATASAIAQTVLSTLQVENGFGRNIQYLTPVQIQNWVLYTHTYILLQTVGTGLVRISVSLFVLRLVPVTERCYRGWIWGLAALNVIVSLGCFFALCFQCIPLAGLWDPSVEARCFSLADMTKIARSQGSTAAITDLLCVLLPMWVFRNLQASLQDKVAIFVILGLGLFTAASALARTIVTDLATKNPTWHAIPVGIWACLEQNIGIAVASLPALRQLLTIRKKQQSSHASEPLCNHNSSSRPPFDSFSRLSDTHGLRLSNHDGGDDDGHLSAETSCRELSTPTPKMMTGCDVFNGKESRHDGISSSSSSKKSSKRPSEIRVGMVSQQPLWADRKVSSAETVEMSRVSPNTTFVERKPSSSAGIVRLSPGMTSSSSSCSSPTPPPPSWGGHRKSSSTENYKNCSNANSRRSSMASPPLSPHHRRRPSSLSSSTPTPKMQQLGRFQERLSRVATPEEIMTLANPAAVGYSCEIQGGTPKVSSPTCFPPW